MPGLNPYIQAQQSRRMGYPSSFQGARGAFGFGVSPLGQNSQHGANDGAAMAAAAAAQTAKHDQLQRERNAEVKASEDKQDAEQARSLAEFRAVRDNLPGNVANREQTQMATAEGIDPSASKQQIADAASGPTRFDANGMPTGAGTQSANLDPSQPAPAGTPGTVQTDEASMRNAVVEQQAKKDGQQAAAGANAYSAGFGPVTAKPVGAGAYSVQPKATPNMNVQPVPPATTPSPAPGSAVPTKAVPGSVRPMPFISGLAPAANIAAAGTPPPKKKTHGSLDDAAAGNLS